MTERINLDPRISVHNVFSEHKLAEFLIKGKFHTWFKNFPSSFNISFQSRRSCIQTFPIQWEKGNREVEIAAKSRLFGSESDDLDLEASLGEPVAYRKETDATCGILKAHRARSARRKLGGRKSRIEARRGPQKQWRPLRCGKGQSCTQVLVGSFSDIQITSTGVWRPSQSDTKCCWRVFRELQTFSPDGICCCIAPSRHSTSSWGWWSPKQQLCLP